MLKLIDVKKIYTTKAGDVAAMDGITVEFPDSGMIFINGKSGSGKTTLLELIDGLVKPDEGTVLIDDIDINKDKSIRKEIGFVFQFPEQQFFEQTVKKEIEFSAKNYGIKKEKVKDVVKLVGLKEDILNKKLNNLSNGERRMVGVASILIYNPNIILFDEPTIGLDYKNKKKVIQLIKNPVGTNEVLKTVDLDSNILIAINNNIADGKDVSWIEQAEFEKLKDAKKDIVVTGLCSKEMRERLEKAEVKNIKEISNIKEAVKHISKYADGDITILTTYTALLKIDKIKEIQKCY